MGKSKNIKQEDTNLKTRLTKKDIEIGEKLVSDYGYWSMQVQQYTMLFRFDVAYKLHTILLAYEKQ